MQNKKTLLLTGATGYIGSMLAKNIICSSDWDMERLILPVRDTKKAETMLREELGSGEVEIVLCKGAVEDWNSENIPQHIDYIIHCACPTRSAEMLSRPTEVADCIVWGTRNILELARQKQIMSMVYLSSMEVYGNIVCEEGKRISEKELGSVALDDPRSCYPMGKRMAEHYCHAFCKEYNVPVKIARLSQAFGWGVPLDDSRIFAQIARAVIGTQDIILHTQGLSMGNYCEISDTVRAVQTILLKGSNGETYNVVNEVNTMRIRDMAELVVKKIAQEQIRVLYEIEESSVYGYAADTGLRLSSQKLRGLGWRPSKDLEEMYRELINWYRQNKY